VGTAGLKTAEEALKNGQPLVIFPEGTRSKDGKLGKAKAGAAMLVNAFDTYVLPITLICKNQQVRPFRKMTLVVSSPVTMPTLAEGTSQRNHLRECTAVLMKPIEEGLAQYGNEN
jgi:1-acyl-sn-glycerol-3-phosphate acyltransferase